MKMFSKKLKTDSYTSLIAKGVTVNGHVSFSDTLKVQGIITGDVIRRTESDKECLIVDYLGHVVADEINVYDAVISGNINCKKLWVENTLRVLTDANIVAEVIYYRALEIEPGAKIMGQMKHLDSVSEGEVT
jgi:cytoskeletal protein CcmA (bactofilin family)